MKVAMFKMLALVFLLAISGTSRAQTVTLSIVRLGCGIPLSPLFPPPKSQQEREQITAEWVEPDELVVESWDNENADSLVNPGTAKARVEGATLTLSYAHKRVVLDRSKPIAECQFLVKLFFTISGLARSHYRLRIEGGNGVVRPTEIDG
jgi:hypothetical protein